jgi:carbon monoxide dehydrogenase subunit G
MDPEVIQRITPGYEQLEQVGPNQYKAKFRVSGFQVVFDGELSLTDIDPQNAYTLNTRVTSPLGAIEGSGRVTLKDSVNPETTTITFDGTANIGEKLANLAGRLIEVKVQQNLQQMFANLSGELVAHH